MQKLAGDVRRAVRAGLRITVVTLLTAWLVCGCARSPLLGEGEGELACSYPLLECSARCVDIADDPANCGACGAACPFRALCDEGSCVTVEPVIEVAGASNYAGAGDRAGGSGYHGLGGAPASAGSTGSEAGGNSGTGGQPAICEAPRVSCSGSCVDTQLDHENCGKCAAGCAPAEVCMAGTCRGDQSIWLTLGGDAQHSGFNRNELGTPPLMPAWSTTVSTLALLPAVSDAQTWYVTSSGYFMSSSSTLQAVSRDDGHVLWTYNFGDVFSVGQATVDSGRVYVAECNNDESTYLYALDAATGKVEWQQPFDAQWEHYWAPLVVGSRLYFDGGEYSGLYGLDTASGKQLFFYDSLEQYDEWSPLALNGTLYTFVAGNLREQDALSGAVSTTWKVNWNWEGWSMQTSPISDGAQIFVIAPPNLYAFRPGSPKPQWTANASYSGMPAVANGVVYAVSAGALQATDAKTGTKLWTFAADGALSFPPVVAGQWVYVASQKNVYAVDVTTHASTWSAAPGGWLSIAHGQLAVSQPDGRLAAYALESN